MVDLCTRNIAETEKGASDSNTGVSNSSIMDIAITNEGLLIENQLILEIFKSI